ncbi:MAG: gamma-glutamyltransferase family protein, partial [Alphaproteobacteria bacterium]|nr:gamma-glutamyltransferase family protein [Alphaproteobacteria bacterium]
MKVAILGLTLLSGVASAAMAQTAAPVTGFYTAGDRATRPATDTVAEGKAVASAADPRAAEAGAEMLRRGGSAADAAAAMLIALTVVEPQSSGIGGGGFLVYHDAKTGRIVTLDGREVAPSAANPRHFFGPDGKPLPFREAVPGGKSVGVPGNIRLVAEMHRRWGRLPWAALFEPSIRLARDGFAASERLNTFTGSRKADLQRSPAASATFLTPAGEPLPEGATVRMPELAWTLERIARLGPDGFYKGPVAKRISTTVSGAPKNPSPLTEADLAAYRVAERPAVCSTYRSYRICGMGPPSSGGIGLAQMLGQLERFDMAKLGPDNVLSWHLFAESQKLAYADRAMWLADPAFAPVPTKGLTDPAYIAARSATIRMEAAAKGVVAGTPPGAPERPRAIDREVPSTSHFVASDAQGDVASLTSTIEGPFGSSLMAGGFMLNNELTDLDLDPVTADGRVSFNRVEPGKRPRS